MSCILLIPLVLSAPRAEERFIVLSEFQVWADAAGPHVFEELNRLYLERGRSDDGKGNYRACCQELSVE